ncbi:hypothetical protein AS026_29680 [Rhizobium altiplani]|uniref:Uncharacterized protein n=1 Tax=Rhizobium altiplani TaxID=1864509 RepID=A0A109JHN2_9HYPH|nr:hypothetical protein AS026_11780 [Rhizobium altiplani]KWV49163.1 hypothetical protein AS026_11405 [Rhizobium altiplani]KWV58844.1 hypothetical protein AS026_29680 [Rhizobium altiplani]
MGSIVPWADQRQVEQDLIICRALIDIFDDDLLSAELRFRGGTAPNKLHFQELAKEAGRCETPAIFVPDLCSKSGAKWMRQRSNLGEHRYVRQYVISR